MTQHAIAALSSSPPILPMALFTFVSSETSTLVQFTDQSTGPPTAWEWKEGANIISTAQNPNHDFVTPGVYSVTLKVTNALGQTDTSPAQEVVVGVDLRIPDDPAAITIVVDSGLDTLGAGSVFSSPTSLREAHAYCSANPGSYEIDIQVDCKLYSNLSYDWFQGTVRHVSTNGQTIYGGNVTINNATQSTWRNLRVYNAMSSYAESGTSSNDSLSHNNCVSVLLENGCFALAQDETVDFRDCDFFIVRNSFIAYSLRAEGGTVSTGGANALLTDQNLKSDPMTGAIYNNVFLCHNYRPQISNGRFLYGGNWAMYYRSYQLLVSNLDGSTDCDIMYNHYSHPFSGWDGGDNVRVHSTNTRFYTEGNTQSGPITTWEVREPEAPTEEVAQITLWPPVWRTDPNNITTVTNENGTSTFDDLEQQIIDDLTGIEINGATPADLPSNASTFGWNINDGVKQNEMTPNNMPDVFTFGRTIIDGNDLKIEVTSIKDAAGTLQTDTYDIDIDLIDGDNVVQWTGHAIIGETLAENTVVTEDITLLGGEFLTTQSVTNATNADPIVITTPTPHGLVSGRQVTITGVTGNTAANGTFSINVTSTTTFSLTGGIGDGAYTGGGTVVIYGELTWDLSDCIGVAQASTGGTLRVRSTYRASSNGVPSVSVATLLDNV